MAAASAAAAAFGPGIAAVRPKKKKAPLSAEARRKAIAALQAQLLSNSTALARAAALPADEDPAALATVAGTLLLRETSAYETRAGTNLAGSAASAASSGDSTWQWPRILDSAARLAPAVRVVAIDDACFTYILPVRMLLQLSSPYPPFCAGPARYASWCRAGGSAQFSA